MHGFSILENGGDKPNVFIIGLSLLCHIIQTNTQVICTENVLSVVRYSGQIYMANSDD